MFEHEINPIDYQLLFFSFPFIFRAVTWLAVQRDHWDSSELRVMWTK